jgi:predicted XRE-type DNA-binding protein
MNERIWEIWEKWVNNYFDTESKMMENEEYSEENSRKQFTADITKLIEEVTLKQARVVECVIEGKVRADERAKVLAEFPKKSCDVNYEHRHTPSDYNIGFNDCLDLCTKAVKGHSLKSTGENIGGGK